MKTSEIVNYEVELIINENLYKRKIITEEIYKKVNEKLIKLIENCKLKTNYINDSG